MTSVARRTGFAPASASAWPCFTAGCCTAFLSLMCHATADTSPPPYSGHVAASTSARLCSAIGPLHRPPLFHVPRGRLHTMGLAHASPPPSRVPCRCPRCRLRRTIATHVPWLAPYSSEKKASILPDLFNILKSPCQHLWFPISSFHMHYFNFS